MFVLVFVVVLISVGAAPKIPILFVVFEVALLAICGWPLFKLEAAVKVAKNLGFDPRRSSRRSGTGFKERLSGAALYAAFVLQLTALVPLLKGTGGPIDSPFSQMTVAVAIFTPFLANEPRTVKIVGFFTGLYYVGLVWTMDDIEKRWSYLAVNLSILALTIVLTLGYIRRREANGVGGTAVADAPAEDPPDGSAAA